MIVNSTLGSAVSLERTDKKSLFDRCGVEWARCPERDTKDPFGCAYRETKNNIACVLLTKEELMRVIAGTHAMQTPTTVEEMRYHALNLPASWQLVVDNWSDQRLREILIEAEDKRLNTGALMEAKVEAEIEAAEREKERAEEVEHERVSREATEGTSVVRKTQGTAKRTPRKRTQEGGLSVAIGETSIALTSKQLEFMERLSECPGWTECGTNGEYVASQYAEELSDTMNPMAVGAVLTTLREKQILTTTKTRMGGVKCCMFKLTETGKQIYKSLAGGVNK